MKLSIPMFLIVMILGGRGSGEAMACGPDEGTKVLLVTGADPGDDPNYTLILPYDYLKFATPSTSGFLTEAFAGYFNNAISHKMIFESFGKPLSEVQINLLHGKKKLEVGVLVNKQVAYRLSKVSLGEADLRGVGTKTVAVQEQPYHRMQNGIEIRSSASARTIYRFDDSTGVLSGDYRYYQTRERLVAEDKAEDVFSLDIAVRFPKKIVFGEDLVLTGRAEAHLLSNLDEKYPGKFGITQFQAELQLGLFGGPFKTRSTEAGPSLTSDFRLTLEPHLRFVRRGGAVAQYLVPSFTGSNVDVNALSSIHRELWAKMDDDGITPVHERIVPHHLTGRFRCSVSVASTAMVQKGLPLGWTTIGLRGLSPSFDEVVFQYERSGEQRVVIDPKSRCLLWVTVK